MVAHILQPQPRSVTAAEERLVNTTLEFPGHPHFSKIDGVKQKPETWFNLELASFYCTLFNSLVLANKWLDFE